MDCPDHDAICELVARRASTARAAEIEAHIADCSDCRKLVFALAGEQTEAPAERIARFELLDVIGQGSMGTVYRARDPELDRIVALKIRRSRIDGATEERLRREARALARLTHPNVVTVYETGSHEGITYVAMEYVQGPTLDRWLAGEQDRDAKLARLIEAGRGLAAAHAVGLIHRDFKPHNVFVASVAKVGDFGLVRIDQVIDSARGGEPALTLSSGALIGTPAYMAPEQLHGGVAIEASDQFSFCVTLYEAMYGKRPFHGETVRELTAAFARPTEFPGRIPARIQRVLARGLDRDPARRFPSMNALLSALTKRPARAWWIAGAGVAGLAAAGLVIATRSSVGPCTGAEDHARAVWNAERGSAIERGFAATKLPYSSDAAKRVRGALDSYSASWVVAHRSACEAGQRREQSPAVLDLRMQCLGERLDDVRALIATLTAADDTGVRRASRAVAALPSIERCLDLDVVMARVRPPEDAATAAAVEQIRRELAAARAELDTGHFAKALAIVEPLSERARTLGYPPLLAETLLDLGRTQVELEDAKATRSLDEAARLAYAARDDETAARAWTELIYAAGYERQDAKAGQEAAGMARAALARVPRVDPAWQVQLLSYEGLLLHARGDYAGARDKHREALALGTKTLPAGHDHLATVRNNLANALLALGARDEALTLLREAIAIREQGVGPLHPDTATNRANLASQLAMLGRYREALVEFDRAIDALTKSLGPDHPALATALANSCGTLEALGRVDEAVERARRALAIFEARLGKSHPTTATALTQLATMLVANRRAGEAVPLFERALAIKETTLGREHPGLTSVLNNLGFARLDLGENKAAIADFERALTIVEHALGPDHPRTVYSLVGLGRAYVDSNATGAVQLLRRAIAVQEKTGAAPAERGEARFVLARASWKTGDRKTATALAEQALADFKDSPTDRAAVEKWREQHR